MYWINGEYSYAVNTSAGTLNDDVEYNVSIVKNS